MRSSLHQLPTWPEDGIINAVIEAPRGCGAKITYNAALDIFEYGRALPLGTTYPYCWGFVPGTKAEDGDPLDVLVLISEPTFPGCVVRARPVGVLDMTDDKGHDYKILAVAHDDPRYEQAQSLEDVSQHLLREIENFFSIYKELEGRATEVRGWLGVNDAERIIETAREAGSRGPGSAAPGARRERRPAAG